MYIYLNVHQQMTEVKLLQLHRNAGGYLIAKNEIRLALNVTNKI